MLSFSIEKGRWHGSQLTAACVSGVLLQSVLRVGEQEVSGFGGLRSPANLSKAKLRSEGFPESGFSCLLVALFCKGFRTEPECLASSTCQLFS